MIELQIYKGEACYFEIADVQPTAEELKTQKQAEIEDLKQQLASSDYKAIKFAEGWLTAEEYAPIKAQRQELRNRINELEGEGDD